LRRKGSPLSLVKLCGFCAGSMEFETFGSALLDVALAHGERQVRCQRAEIFGGGGLRYTRQRLLLGAKEQLP
jgi:hypothetical protein